MRFGSGSKHGCRPFVIFAQGRSGSTLLGSLLGSHPLVVFEDEILHSPVASPMKHVLRRRAANQDRSFGFHVKWYQLQFSQGMADHHAFLEELSARGFRIFHLRRENVLRQALSTIVAARRGAYFQRDAEGADHPPAITVDPTELFDRMAERVVGTGFESRALRGVQHERVVYEQDLLDARHWQSTSDRLLALLGLESAPVATSLRRTGSDRISDQIANWPELESALRGTPWERYLEDPIETP